MFDLSAEEIRRQQEAARRKAEAERTLKFPNQRAFAPMRRGKGSTKDPYLGGSLSGTRR